MTPRLLASVPRELALIEAMRQALSTRYGEDFVRTTAALYRDGADSVAWHGDTTARDMEQAIVATVSLGQPRKLLLRPMAGGDSIAYRLGPMCQRRLRQSFPDIFVPMGGEWFPKRAQATPSSCSTSRPCRGRAQAA